MRRRPHRTGEACPDSGAASEWLETPALCAELAITSNNCGVMLYRARMQLRECLDRNWFQVRA